MIVKECCLVKLNARNKVHKVLVQLDYHAFNKIYTLTRKVNQWDGKILEAPMITIEYGRRMRTISEEANLRYQWAVDHYVNMGYAKLSLFTKKHYDDISEEEVNAFLQGKFKTSKYAVSRPMIPKSVDNCSHNILEKPWMCTKKVNGIQCLLFFKEGAVIAVSRDGINMSAATQHIRNNPLVMRLFQTNPSLVLDGMLYIPNVDISFQRLTSLVNDVERQPECDMIEYWVYDYISDELFRDRLESLEALSGVLTEVQELVFPEYKEFNEGYKIEREHNRYIREGFVGLLAKNPVKPYGVGKRSSVYSIEMCAAKQKNYIIEDVVEELGEVLFLLKTSVGNVFKAKAVGSKKYGKSYIENKDEYKGKYAQCVFVSYQNKVPSEAYVQYVLKEEICG